MHQAAAVASKKGRGRTAASQRPPNASRGDWNVQVVKGKVTSKCLWNACKALSLGIILMVLGAGMAILGYYADQLSVNQEIRGNTTVKVKNESRGFHLNNFSYAGPIVMGVGGFIVVAACVMTFEARDSAAKVVPAKFKPKASPAHRYRSDDGSGRRSTSCQTRWDNLGVFRAAAQGATALGLATPLASAVTSPAQSMHRRELKQSFLNFSKTFQSSIDSAGYQTEDAKVKSPTTTINAARRNSLAKCPSAPNIAALSDSGSPLMQQLNMLAKPVPPALLGAGNASSARASNVAARRQSSSIKRGCPLLSPHPLQRQALSVDYTNINYSPLIFQQQRRPPPLLADSPKSSVERAVSEASMAMDLHLPDDCQVTLKVRDQSRVMPPRLHQRSETARRHQLTRQKQVVELETSVNDIQIQVPDVKVRRHHSSKRDGTKRHHRHRVKRSNTCATPQDASTRHPHGDATPTVCISLTPSPERSHASCNLQVQIDNSSNPPSSNQSFEMSTVGSDVEAGPSCSYSAPLLEEKLTPNTETKIHIEEAQ
ncbi:uncharacterized protein LOC132192535 [Neocloeon triangulifer]|uniref:uncharacterized protein LOC132192535 n=1 Tax=Neocloeon triangulifer TaxID=2078957 RepID=UPI00286EDCB4|nr:uncharacterized protein LOC132192535 [Neocloeon triangulifer]